MILPSVVKSPVRLGLSMPKNRWETGWVEVVGKHVKKWRGHYHVYRTDENGRETRHHRTITLGLRAALSKREAQDELRKVIARFQSAESGFVPSKPTLQWFWEARYLPMRKPRLKRSSIATLVNLVETHILPTFGDIELGEITRFECQEHLNRLGRRYSKTILQKARVYLKAILEEAFEEELIDRNPARKIEIPRVRERAKRVLSEVEINKLLACLHGRDHLIAHLFIACGFRPGELFVLRWDDWEPGLLRVDESVWRGEIDDPKTKTSIGYVVLPKSAEAELAAWYKERGKPQSRDLIFPSKKGTPIWRDNWQSRVLQPAAKHAGLENVNFQVLRRSFATALQKYGNVKDIQGALRHASPDLTAKVSQTQLQVGTAG